MEKKFRKIITFVMPLKDPVVYQIFLKYSTNKMYNKWFKEPYLYAFIDDINNRVTFQTYNSNNVSRYDGGIVWGLLRNPHTGDVKILIQKVKKQYIWDLTTECEYFMDIKKYIFFLSKDNLKRVLKTEKYPFWGFYATVAMEKNTYFEDFNPADEELKDLSIFSCHSWGHPDDCFGHVFDFANIFFMADEKGKLCCPEDLEDYIFLPYKAD